MFSKRFFQNASEPLIFKRINPKSADQSKVVTHVIGDTQNGIVSVDNRTERTDPSSKGLDSQNYRFIVYLKQNAFTLETLKNKDQIQRENGAILHILDIKPLNRKYIRCQCSDVRDPNIQRRR